ncbi:MAG: hypothetical protein IIT36_04955 [Aeriscardovia sp.]|nr:hypothetical protein [Aeriscardovia sp.]
MMELNRECLRKAMMAFYDAPGSAHDGVAPAIEAYLAEMFKPGQIQMLEPLEVIPQRDYRKELWIGVQLKFGSSKHADDALADFDIRFHKESTHG